MDHPSGAVAGVRYPVTNYLRAAISVRLNLSTTKLGGMWEKWQWVSRRPVRFTLNLKWFRRQGLLFLDDFTSQTLKLEFTR
jgi:hypothetical protein